MKNSTFTIIDYAAQLSENGHSSFNSDWKINGGSKELPINTLWIPDYSGNRTATLNLNHKIDGFENGILRGANGNCSTPYSIIDVPHWFAERHIEYLGREISKKLNKAVDYPTIRSIKSDRIDLIKDIINRMSPSKERHLCHEILDMTPGVMSRINGNIYWNRERIASNAKDVVMAERQPSLVRLFLKKFKKPFVMIDGILVSVIRINSRSAKLKVHAFGYEEYRILENVNEILGRDKYAR